ncbi:LacI family DNA-binding transcriptional regulator [Sanguibacter suaedae]|uniref:LacI family DNA-binding transcriptional regulator n=1 Tax=Sanguibacter suaedae TaxID=2795737 RepID=A0A934I466_9MICO|nr:LacI family DNA-binding transcriptional regulator [Sanguibacter suaedae]MBI9113911.1 LacI family DNA-binding transcriptional regulator [Sanguibacter suaedae]
MNDVARAAGVSHQTVSRVLNAHPNVRPETRERVLVAIAELGYRRNSAARALVTRRSGTLGVVTTGSFLFGPSSTLVAIEEAAREAGYYISVATLRTVDVTSMTEALEHFMGQGVDGIVVIAPHADVVDAVRAFEDALPMVVVASIPDPPESVTTVAVDQELGARLVVRHLAALGHEEVVHLSGPQDWLDAEGRVVGWREESRALGLRVAEPVAGDWTAGCGYDVGRRLVEGDLPTAVFAANDQLALGLLRAFHEAGLVVPRDVSVVGFDDITGAANFIPPLTTVRPGFALLGALIIETILAALQEGAAQPASMVPELVVRASTAPPR